MKALARPRVFAPTAEPDRSSRLTALGWLVLVEAVALASTSVWQPQPLGTALAVGLLAALALAAWRAQRSLADVGGAWYLPDHPHAGEETILGARLSAPRGAPPLQVEAYQPDHRRREVVIRLHGLDGIVTRPTWSARFPRRGLVHLPPLVVGTIQPFGLIRACRTVGDEAAVLVLPTLGRMRRELRSRLNQWLESNVSTMEAGDDEIARLRDYRAGDHPHRIHWKASARNRTLLVTERHAPGCRRLALVVDTDARLDSQRMERLISIAATLTDHFLGLGWNVSLHGAFAPTGLLGNRNYLLEALALATAGNQEVAAFLPSGSLAVVLALKPFTPVDVHPQPLVLTLTECEQLVRLPRRMR